ncbi:hypothetical protein BGX34_008233 [Mortierella sp. NVP85]|nr:hypothetical protein BGX34_008233 [Mortierella sp. NVP85]
MRATAIATTAILWLSGIASITPLSVVNADVKCYGGAFNAQFNPGVTFKNQTIQVAASGDLGVCQSSESSKITGGAFNFVGSNMGSCPGPFAVGYGELQIKWSDESIITIPQMSFKAEAFTWSLDGQFEGKNVSVNGRATISPIDIGAQCATSGLTNYAGSIDAFVF